MRTVVLMCALLLAAGCKVDSDDDGTLKSADCDDQNGEVHPDAVETCNGKDDNCNGSVDEDPSDGTLAFIDLDNDGFGDADTAGVSFCEVPAGFVAGDSGDCNDDDAMVRPDLAELCNGRDDNCNKIIDEGVGQDTFFRDADGDGYGDVTDLVTACVAPEGYVPDPGDCNDASADAYPGAPEVCNGDDDDCDGSIDEDVGSATVWHPDSDRDGYGNDLVSVEACEAPDGFVERGGDCDDSDAAFHPDAPETDCTDLNDYNCDGSVAFDDRDGDKFTACEDCDDGNPDRNPGETDICNGIDDNCDSAIDEDVPQISWYEDADGDTFGADSTEVVSCASPGATYVDTGGDCDDTLDTVFPFATEFCNGVDDDCDAVIDNDPIDPDTFYADTDTDGYGDLASTSAACAAPSGFVADSTDCDDALAAVNPAATEVCDRLDNDCDGSIDIGAVDGVLGYPDTDSDTYGDTLGGVNICRGTAGFVTDSTDCDDTNASVNPAATEVCDNGLDDNCDKSASPCGLEGVLYPADGELAAAETSEALLGFHVGTSDLDGDGLSDVLSGAPSAGSYAGKLWLAYGPAPSDGSTAVEYTGLVSNDLAGYDVSGLGDIDGDGFGDASVGALGANSAAGAVYIVYGSSTRLTGGDLSTFPRFDGGVANDGLAAARPAGDVFGDGQSDLLIGGLFASDGSLFGGSVYLIDSDGTKLSGTANPSDVASAIFTGFDFFSLVGDVASEAGGDLDGDGLSDLAFGGWDTSGGAGPYTAGAYLFYSDAAPSGIVSVEDANAIFTIATSSQRRVSLESGGDVDGDGFQDLAVAVEGISTSEFAEVFLYYGSSTQLSGASDLTSAEAIISGSASDDAFSLSFGDLDNDGRSDIAVGSPLYDGFVSDGGHVEVFPGERFSGAISLSSAPLEFLGDADSSYFGYSIDSRGDVSGDGTGDIVVGAPEGTASGNGKLYIFFGTSI